MLRINLLPPYIHDAAKRRNVVILWVVILILVIGGMVFAKTSIDKDTEKVKSDTAALESTATKADNDQKLADSVNAQSQTVRDKYKFVQSAREHDEKVYPGLYGNAALYTWSRVLYDSIRPAGDTIEMSAYTPTLADVGQYILAMERNPQISRVDIRMNSIPGFPSAPGGNVGQQSSGTGVRPLTGGGHDFDVTVHLYKPIPAGPTYPAGGGGGGTGGGFGGGMGGGMGPMGMGPMGGGMMSGGMMSGGGGPVRGGKAGAAE